MAKGSTSSRAPGKGASPRAPAPRPRAARAKRARPAAGASTRAAAPRGPAAGRMRAGAPSQTVGFRMPPRTASAIKAEARRRGTTISALLLEMWAAYRPKG